jgi:hypothetical protein
MKRAMFIRLATMMSLAWIAGEQAAAFGPAALVPMFMLLIAGAAWGTLSGFWLGRHRE